MTNNYLKKEADKMIDRFMNNSFDILDYDQFNKPSTAIVVVDMLNGFAKSGNLYSERIGKIITNIKKLLENLDRAEKLFLCDSHPSDAVEFNLFPEHCITDTIESDIVDELLPFSRDAKIINKKSTNGYLEPNFQDWLNNNDITDYIIVGCCTDLCISQFTITLKAQFNRTNNLTDIIIPMDAVETYDLDATNHPGDLMNLIALKQMQDNGIKIIRKFK